ncbi:MAG: diguanylate cyclase [Magnetococcales bacterium]|nr:diguanylate cyclase [Magnetococcales bacterium]
MNGPVGKTGKGAIESLLIRSPEDLGKDLPGLQEMFRSGDEWDGLAKAMPKLATAIPSLPEDLQEILSLRYPDRFDLTPAAKFGERLRNLEPEEIRSALLETILYRYWIHGTPVSKEFDPRLFWRHSLAVACISRDLARESKQVDPEKSFLVGLCHDLGRVLLEKFGWRGYSDFLQLAPRSGVCLHAQEQEMIGLGHQELGAWWLRMFDLPKWLVDAVLHHHEGGEDEKKGQTGNGTEATGMDPGTFRMAEIVQLADFIAWTQGLGSVPGPRQPLLGPKMAQALDLEQPDWSGIMARLDAFLAVTADQYGYDMPNGMQFRRHLLGATLRLGQMVRDQQQNATGDPMPVREQTNSLLIPHQSLDEEWIVPNTLQAIRKEYKFNTLCMFHVDPDDRTLVPGIRTPAFQGNRDFSQLRIPLTQVDSGFRECLRDRRPRIIKGRTAIEKEILRKMGVDEIGVVAVFGKFRVHGLLWLDYGFARKKMAESDLTEVAVVARELGVALEHVRLYQEARKQADYDAMTGLFNRKRIETGLQEALHETNKNNGELSLLMTDLDQFRQVNDQIGNQKGDGILKLLAEIQKRSIRENGLIGRFEGDKFLIVLNHTNFSAAIQCGERLRKTVEKVGQQLAPRLNGIKMTLSVGVTTRQGDQETGDDLLTQADRALQMAKEGGCNTVVGHVPRYLSQESDRKNTDTKETASREPQPAAHQVRQQVRQPDNCKGTGSAPVVESASLSQSVS